MIARALLSLTIGAWLPVPLLIMTTGMSRPVWIWVIGITVVMLIHRCIRTRG